jgi:hypothetical protein
MGASNWTACPRCLQRASAARAADVKQVAGSYGKVSEAECIEAVKSIAEVNPANFGSFREDYEIYGAEQGTVTVGYSGRCDPCGLSVDFSHEHEIPGVNE